MTGLPCDLCVEARASSARGGVVECACGEVYERGRWVALRPLAHALVRVTAAGAQLVFHAPTEPTEPTEPPRRPPQRLLSGVVEGQEVVQVRQLLCELRPSRSGPMGWAPDGHPPPEPPTTIVAPGCAPRLVVGPLVRVAMRVQSSAPLPTILPGAFREQAEARAVSPAERRALAIWGGPPTAVATTLRWLQQHGTLAAGLPALYEALAAATATSAARGQWSALETGTRRTAQRGWGRARVAEAMAAWRREAP
ncbi:MAG: hypothetical protein JNK72_00280 [Myxococcales bacterium]|nr:hypothetical protein [Myxococcales bacterium]